ncbi:MAG: hypothetical protein ACJ8CR_29485 [Roseiflexaceae bacterium]
MPIEISITNGSALAPAATSTTRIASVAYATDESASDEKTASATSLCSRWWCCRSVASGWPTRKRFTVSIITIPLMCCSVVGVSILIVWRHLRPLRQEA